MTRYQTHTDPVAAPIDGGHEEEGDGEQEPLELLTLDPSGPPEAKADRGEGQDPEDQQERQSGDGVSDVSQRPAHGDRVRKPACIPSRAAGPVGPVGWTACATIVRPNASNAAQATRRQRGPSGWPSGKTIGMKTMAAQSATGPAQAPIQSTSA